MAAAEPDFRGAISDDEARSLLADLVRIPSINPLHRDLCEPPFGEGRIVQFLEEFARDLHLTTTRQPVLPGRDNLLVWLPGAEPERRLLFECHLDTVPGWSGDPGPFEPRVIGDRLHGLGACDVKGTLAAMLLALRLLVRRGLRPARTIVLAATVDEEHQARGVRQLAADGPFAEAAVVGEPTDLRIVIAHKGCVRWRVTARGRAAHSSKADLGVNAIDVMVDVLAAIGRELQPILAGRSHPLVGGPSLSVCTIHGGVAANVIPDLCIAEIDRRTLPGEEVATVIGELEAAVARIAARVGGRVELEAPFVVEPGLDTSPDEAIVRDLQQAVARITGQADLRGVPFGTDASTLSRIGIPTVVFGSGSIDLAHTREESIGLSEVARAAEIFATLALTPPR